MSSGAPSEHGWLQTGLPEILRWQSVGGGCIADSGRAELADGRTVFVKQGAIATDQFPAEAAGLDALRISTQLRIPEVLAVSKDLLALEWIETGRAPAGFWRAFGQGFASLHSHSAERCGFEHDNYLGSSRQLNQPVKVQRAAFSANPTHIEFANDGPGTVQAANQNPVAGDGSDWPEFYLQRRLRPQVEWAAQRSGGAVPVGLFEAAEDRIVSLLEVAIEPPSLLHGDLWSGNFMIGADGKAVLIDPAVYFGHREADLAMTRLFGGFDEEFYSSYDQTWPLQPGWQERLPVYQLYHLLNHYNLFGGSYLASCRRILSQLAA